MDDEFVISSVLTTRTVNTLARNGINTIEQIKLNYPENLLRINGFGICALREVEAAFFPREKYQRKVRKHNIGRPQQAISEELARYLHSHKTID